MNPKTVIPAATIGAVVGLALGYTVASLGPGGATSFIVWAGFDSRYIDHYDDALAWATGGIIVGAAAAFLWRQKSD